MIENFDVLYDWSPESMLEVILPTPDAFLKIKETLTKVVYYYISEVVISLFILKNCLL